MIRLEVQLYCQQCLVFEADVESPIKFFGGNEVVEQTDTVIRCKNRDQCERLKQYLDFDVKQAIEICDQLNKKNDKAVSPLMTSLSLSVVKINSYGDQMTWECLYDCISDYETANALAQLAMSEKEYHELIIIMPGWNRGIKKYPDEYKEALRLAEEHKIY